jgi:hypothetical protein
VHVLGLPALLGAIRQADIPLHATIWVTCPDQPRPGWDLALEQSIRNPSNAQLCSLFHVRRSSKLVAPTLAMRHPLARQRSPEGPNPGHLRLHIKHIFRFRITVG